jgi:septal ring factor EnvC (AmiA/AmiB activator)
VSAEWLEDPGEVLERLREQQHDGANDAEELEARKKGLAKRLGARQAEKDRYVRTYAQGHISEEELDAYLAELKKQTDNLRVMLASVDAELSERRERTALTDTTHAWLLSLRKRLDEVEEDTPEWFEKRKQLVGLLVESISLGKSQQEGRAEVQITYRFGPPPVSDTESDGSFMPGFKNGRESITPGIDTPTLTVIAVR